MLEIVPVILLISPNISLEIFHIICYTISVIIFSKGYKMEKRRFNLDELVEWLDKATDDAERNYLLELANTFASITGDIEKQSETIIEHLAKIFLWGNPSDPDRSHAWVDSLWKAYNAIYKVRIRPKASKYCTEEKMGELLNVLPDKDSLEKIGNLHAKPMLKKYGKPTRNYDYDRYKQIMDIYTTNIPEAEYIEQEDFLKMVYSIMGWEV